MAKSYYDVLGVSKTATEDEIKQAYRKLARQYHPDLHPDDKDAAEKFKEISEAYDTLGNKEKRAAYDNPSPFGNASGGGSADFSGFGGFGGFGGGSGGIFDSIFDMFGGGSGGRSAQRENVGADLEQNLTLTFEEAAFGVSKEIKITRNETCSSCKGTGAKDGTKYHTCPTCGGSGRVRSVQDTPFGRIANERVCSTCRGSGKVIDENCPDCGGRGIKRRNVTLRVSIPAGVESGQTLTVQGEGEKVLSGRNGDLYLNITVMSHKIFTRRGMDLYLDFPVTFTQAILGEKVNIPQLKGGTFAYTLPEGIIGGTTVRVRGQGITTRRGTGDMYVTFIVDMPRKLSRDQKAKIQQLASDMKIDQFDKVKDFNKRAGI